MTSKNYEILHYPPRIELRQSILLCCPTLLGCTCITMVLCFKQKIKYQVACNKFFHVKVLAATYFTQVKQALMNKIPTFFMPIVV